MVDGWQAAISFGYHPDRARRRLSGYVVGSARSIRAEPPGCARQAYSKYGDIRSSVPVEVPFDTLGVSQEDLKDIGIL